MAPLMDNMRIRVTTLAHCRPSRGDLYTEQSCLTAWTMYCTLVL